jgi:hypothetical protein
MCAYIVLHSVKGEKAVITHSEMEKRQKREEREYRQMLTATESRDKAFGVMPQSYLSHTSEITVDNLDSSIEYLDKLLTRARVFHNQISLVSDGPREAAIEAYYRSLQAAEDFSIQCLDIAGKLLESGEIDDLDPRVFHIVRFFCDIKDETPKISPQAAEGLKKIDIFDGNDPFEMEQFRKGAASSICSLATIPSGRILLRSLFNLRYYDPKLEINRREDVQYIPSTMRIFNPLSRENGNMSPMASTPQGISKPGQISKDGQATVIQGDYRQDVLIVAPIPEYDDFVRSTLETIPPINRTHLEKLQHMAPIMMGHEMIHTLHISYGVPLMMETDSKIRMEERVTAGDRVAITGHKWEPERADVAAYDHADDSVKEAFMVSEQSLREDYGTVKRHSYEKLLDINSTTDGLTEEERYVFLLTDQIIRKFTLGGSIWSYSIADIFSTLRNNLKVLSVAEDAEWINSNINSAMKDFEKRKDDVIKDVFDIAFAGIVFEQGISKSSPLKNVIKAKMLGLYMNNDSFWSMIKSLMITRIKKDVLANAMRPVPAKPVTRRRRPPASTSTP